MTSPLTKPMLADHFDPDQLILPCIAMPKLDGVRCHIRNGRAVTRAFKPIPNDHIRSWLEEFLPEGIEGEITLSDHRAGFNAVQSAVMSKEGEPVFRFWAFDYVADGDTSTPFEDRIAAIYEMDVMGRDPSYFIQPVPSRKVLTREALMAFHAQWIDEGYEGTIVRDPKGPYKLGRSTVKQGWFLKLKDLARETAYVLDMTEEMENTNVAKKGLTGKTERSSAKAGKVGKDTMGALVCTFPDGATFKVSSGFTQEQRKHLWDNPEEALGRYVEVEHQPAPGGRQEGQAPRFPTFKGFRSEADL